jgi:SAM-dependent methyltransferase
MLKDGIRTVGFHQAISQIVKPGDVVLDMGAGTGILSIFASQAGARHVYAVERTPMAVTAKDIIETNGLSERITVLRQDVRDVTLPESVDVLISEWMGSYGIDENFLQPLLVARDRWLKPDGRMVPSHVAIYLAPIWDARLDEELQFWHSHPYGIDLSPVADRTVNELIGQYGTPPLCLSKQSLRAHPRRLWEIDAYNFPEKRAAEPFQASVTFEIEEPSRINCLAAWFTAELAPTLVLTNALGSPATHWGVARLPLTRPTNVDRGSRVVVELTCTPAGRGYAYTEWAVKVDSGDWEHHSDNPAAFHPA